jgi:hypothetical protein
LSLLGHASSIDQNGVINAVLGGGVMTLFMTGIGLQEIQLAHDPS